MRALSGAFRGGFIREMAGFLAAKDMRRRLYAFRRNKMRYTDQRMVPRGAGVISQG